MSSSPPPGAPQLGLSGIGYVTLVQRRSDAAEGRREIRWPSLRWFPRQLRSPALARLGGTEFDLVAAHPSILVAMLAGTRPTPRLAAFAAGGATRDQLLDGIINHYTARRARRELAPLTRPDVKALLRDPVCCSVLIYVTVV